MRWKVVSTPKKQEWATEGEYPEPLPAIDHMQDLQAKRPDLIVRIIKVDE
jgi:hypothetical protein